ncbi:MAG: NAD(P)-binding protein, partial [Pseudobdellovibrionaceae bacterium]
MQSTSRKSNHIYDYAVIGSGLAGLTVANALSRMTSNVILIESADTFGGLNRSIQTPFGAVNNGLRYLPDSELSQKAIAFLEMLLMTSLSPESFEAPPMTYEAGGLRPFVGFGN